MSMNPVIHFELPADDRGRMASFYSDVFGWKTQQLGPEMNHYVVVSTTETGYDGRPTTPGTINGGIFDRVETNQHPVVVIAVDDIQDAVSRVTDAGGRVLGGKPEDIPGVGLYAAFIDTEGNRVAMLQPRM